MNRSQYSTEAQQYEAVENFAAELDHFLRKHFGYRSGLTFANTRTIDVRRAKVRLYLRLCYKPQGEHGFWPQWTLVIASIEFRDLRSGHGRSLLEFLVKQAGQFGYDKIGVESAGHGEGIQGFCRHFFNPYRQADSLNPDANWIASISDISQRLAVDREVKACSES